jgi:L-lysine 2,3-aminomutase
LKTNKANNLIAGFLAIRNAYLNENIDDRIQLILEKLEIQVDKSNNSLLGNAEDWNDINFHLENRIHLTKKSDNKMFDLLFELYKLNDIHKNKLKEIIRNGIEFENDKHFLYDFSLLPLNIVLGQDVIKYFIPPADYFSQSMANHGDPYGIIEGRTRSKGFENLPTAIKGNESNLLLGANKFTHSLLFNIDFYCPIGCSDCYKARMGTREYSPNGENKSHIIKYLGEVITPTKKTVVEQAKQTVKWMNTTERGRNVYDLIISGGEPLMLSNSTLELMLEEFSSAKNLKILRICTGALFLGLPFRIDKELLSLLKSFSDKTGIRITFQAHIGNHQMISPESIIAVQRIKNFGFNIYAQIPVKNEINFFLSDPKKTVDMLSLLMHKLVIADVEPYMMIVDMHPSTNEFYVPIEPLLQIWGDLVESHDFPGLEKPRTLSMLFEQGNIILSGNSLFALTKEIDTENLLVHYQVPRVGIGENWEGSIREFFKFSEPLLIGINDNPNSLNTLKSKLN